MKRLLPILSFFLVIVFAANGAAEAPPGVSPCAGSSVAIPNDDNDDDDGLQLTISGPCTTVPMGHTFSLTINWATEESDYEVQALNVLHIHGCTELANSTQFSLESSSATAWYELQMDEGTCDFVIQASSIAGGILTPTDEIYARAAINVAAYTLQDIGQEPGRGLGEDVIPVLIAFSVLIFALFRTLNHHPAWNGLFLIAFLGLTTEALGFMDLTTGFMLFVAGGWMSLVLVGKKLGFQQKDGENENG